MLFVNKDLLLINNGRKIIPTLGLKHSHPGNKIIPRWDWYRRCLMSDVKKGYK